MSNILENRYEFVFLFDVENGNPNGDPDAGNLPRTDSETGHGLVTDVCLKRKVRNFIDLFKGEEDGFGIYVRERAVLSSVRAAAYGAADKTDKKNSDKTTQTNAQAWMCKNFFDVRTFGAVMSMKANNCGQVRGPVQFTFARSIDPIDIQEVGITRVAVETEEESKKQNELNQTMGRKNIVSYGLYRMDGYVSAPLAGNTGFSQDDLEVLWSALINMFEHDHSASRGKMSARGLYIFKHDTALGCAPAHSLFKLVDIQHKNADTPARSFDDYAIVVNDTAVPAGVSLEKRL